MRIKYEYKEYQSSKKATNISHTLNAILAYLSIPLIISNIYLFAFGILLYEAITIDAEFSGVFVLFYIAAILLDFLFLVGKMSIDVVSENAIIREKNTSLSEEEISLLTRKNWKSHFTDILPAFITIIAIGVIVPLLPMLYYSFKESNWGIFFTSLIISIISIVYVTKRMCKNKG